MAKARFAPNPLKVMRRTLSLLLCLQLSSSVLPAQSVSRHVVELGPDNKLPKVEFVPGEIMVRFRPGSTPPGDGGDSPIRLRDKGRSILAKVDRFEGAEVVKGLRLARVRPEETIQAVAALKARPDVLYAEPNYIRRLDRVPNDARYAEMWSLKNTGQSEGLAGADIKAEQAWDISTGDRGVVVGVIDEGVDVNHPDLQANLWRNTGEVPGNGVDDDGDGFIDDVNGYDFVHDEGSVYDGKAGDNDTDAHGTHVAGTIGAEGDNGVGVVGVNWQVSLMSLKILSSDSGKLTSSTNVRLTVRAYNYAKMMRDLWVSSGGTRGANIRVLNNSYGGRSFSQAELDAIRALNDSGILFVAAAGNNGQNDDDIPHYPSSYDVPNIISVAATDRGDNFATFTNTGNLTVHLTAPGAEILSTTPNGTYSVFSGTSMAAPHVAGAAALICAAYPGISVSRLRAALLSSGDRTASSRGAGTMTGRRLNLFSALQNAAIKDETPPAAVKELKFNPSNPGWRSGSLEWYPPGDDGDAGGQTTLFEVRFSDSDITTPAQFEQARLLFVGNRDGSGAPLSGYKTLFNVAIPYQHPSGYFGIREIDKAGNAGPVVTVRVSVDLNNADPYFITQTSSGTLSTGGTPLNLKADDKYKEDFALPFTLPFFRPDGGPDPTSVTISTNGTLYFTQYVPKRSNCDADDAVGSVRTLNIQPMVAGLWDDLRTDRRADDDIYVVTPDSDRIIFRWQAVTFDTPLAQGVTRGEQPVNFEIELRRDGVIQVRYGEGNTNVFPVVGLSSGRPDAYAVAPLISESDPIDLTDASAVTFTPRLLLPSPTATPTPGPNPGAGGRILYTNNIPGGSSGFGNNEIFSVGLDGSNPVNLTNDPATDTDAAWSPDGKKIAFDSARSNSDLQYEIFVMSADGSEVRQLTNGTINNRSSSPAWSPDGTKIVYSKGNGFYVMNADGSNQTQLSSGYNYQSPVWSPDGTKIAYSDTFNIGVMNADGSSPTPLTNNLVNSYTPKWSPDGSKIVFTSTLNGSSGIFVINANGTNLVQLTSSGDTEPCWSPDGSKIAMSRNGEIYTMNADGTNQVLLPVGSGYKSSPAWGTQANSLIPEQKAELRTWTSGGSTYEFVKLSFQNASYRLTDPGRVIRSGNDFTVNVGVDQGAGSSVGSVSTTAQIYDLGSLPSGTYTFTFKSNNFILQTQNFTVNANLPLANPVDNPREFVRRQYLDFLGREPDGPGWDFWTREIAVCRGNTACIDRKRTNTSGAYFLSTEFQSTGYFVYRFYKGALNRLPKLSEFTPDTQTVASGIVVNDALDYNKIEANKESFAAAWVNRSDFKAIYDPLTNQQYVDRLFQTTNVAVSGGDKAALVAGLNNNAETRASVLRKIVDGTTLDTATGAPIFHTAYGQDFYRREYNAAFVLMQYFGYLRRDIDEEGYQFWLAKLNQYGNFKDAEMVRSFVLSAEYRSRFGQP